MSLIARLETAAKQLPPSHHIDFPSLGATLGAIVQFLEHGEDFLDAAEDADRGVLAFLTEHAEGVNEQVASEQAQAQANAPNTGAVIQQPAVPIAPAPGQPAQFFNPPPPAFGVSTGRPPVSQPPSAPPAVAGGAVANPGVPELMQAVGQLMAELQAQRAATGHAQRATVESFPPDPAPVPDEPAEPGPIVPPTPPIPERAGEQGGAGSTDPAPPPTPSPGGDLA